MFVEMSDAALAQRVAEGDRDGEAEVCRRMGPRIRLYGLRHLRSVAADDLVQQVPLTTLERLLGEHFFEHTRTIPGPPGWEW